MDRRLLATAVVLILALAGGRGVADAAPAAVDPLLELPLYTGYVGLRTAATGRPTVQVYGAGGNLRIEVEAAGERPADGHWTVQLSPPGDLTNQVLLQPGDRVEAAVDGRITSLTVPDMTAEVDAAADTVSGQVPPTAGVYVQVHRDPLWYAEEPNPPGEVVAVGSGGRYRADLAGQFDLRPGTWGEVAMLHAEGHVFLVPFAVPAVTLDADQYLAQVRAAPDTGEVVLAFEDGQGGQRFRSVPALAAGGGVFVPNLFLSGRPEYGVFLPEPGDELVVFLDGREALREVVPWVTTTVRFEAKEVAGLAPPGAHVAVTFYPTDGDNAPGYRGHTTAGADGSYVLDASAVNVITGSARSVAVGYPGASAAFAARGGVPRQTVHLYGRAVSGTLAGWGRVTVTHVPAGAGATARADVRATSGGAFSAELFAAGEPAVLAPGDRLTVSPERGEGLDLTIPDVTAVSDPAARTLTGQAPPAAAVTVYAFAAAPDYFGNQQYQQPFALLYTHADEAGRYSVRCTADDCGTRYGVTYARLGQTSFALEWLDAPLVGVGVTLADALAKATAGTRVTVTPMDANGQPGAPRTGLVTPALSGGLPEWSADLGDVFAEPMAVGDRVRIEVGALVAEVEVPALSWQVSPARDDVRGQGPPFHTFLAVAAARQDDRQPPYGTVSGVTDAAGRFEARFPGFDVRPGDDAELYLLRANHFLWWTAKGVRDPEPEVTPTPTAEPAPRGIYLPYSARDTERVPVRP